MYIYEFSKNDIRIINLNSNVDLPKAGCIVNLLFIEFIHRLHSKTYRYSKSFRFPKNYKYLPFDEEGAHCLFQLISKRYEKSSTIFTSNKSYGEWGEVFKDHVIAAAVLDRILHHCIMINIKGDSYRVKKRKKKGIK